MAQSKYVPHLWANFSTMNARSPPILPNPIKLGSINQIHKCKCSGLLSPGVVPCRMDGFSPWSHFHGLIYEKMHFCQPFGPLNRCKLNVDKRSDPKPCTKKWACRYVPKWQFWSFCFIKFDLLPSILLTTMKFGIYIPGRALIHVFSNPSATEGYLSWGYLSKKLEFFAPY